MNIEDLKLLFETHKETHLYHRYITNTHIAPLLKKVSEYFDVEVIGRSVLEDSISAIKVGSGKKRILMWSQMHGNESTTTKAIFDLLNTLHNETEMHYILEECTLYIIPILNPDGANAYTRVNANEVDLNRDAQNQTEPESGVLKTAFKRFKPHFCFNLHGQRTIFSAGETNNPATVSFLAPAQDKNCTITPTRKIAMEVIGVMNDALKEIIPNQIGVYDDAFNINCVGDAFQSENVPTILFEAGHYPNDYEREKTRKFIYISYLTSLSYIAKNNVDGSHYKSYFKIPENGKYFYDVIIRNAKFEHKKIDIGILFQEKLINSSIEFLPKVEKMDDLESYFAHNEFDAKHKEVLIKNNTPIQEGFENVCVIVNNEKIALFRQ